MIIPNGCTTEIPDQLPPIPDIIVIPNSIGFLSQFVSALLLVLNGAPGKSNLVVKDLKATVDTSTIILPEA